MKVSIKKRIAEMYCENPTYIHSLYVDGKVYTREEVISIALEYCRDRKCKERLLETISDENFTRRISPDAHKNLMKSFRNNIQDLKGLSE